VKKLVCFAILLCVVFAFVFGEDIIYEVTRETPLVTYRGRGEIRTLAKGEKLYNRGKWELRPDGKTNIRIVTEQGEDGSVNIDDILLVGSQVLPERIISKEWIYSFYQDILVERDREALFRHETFWRDSYPELAAPIPYFLGTYWWEHFYPTYFDIYNNNNNIVVIGELFWGDSIYLMSIQQQQNKDIMTLEVICTAKRNDFPENPINKLFEEGNEYTIILKLDGDYMDFYVGDESNKVCTLIGIDKPFFDSIVGIVRGENVDLSQLTWPRRADGSMDYPLPQPTQAVPEQPETVTIDTPQTEYEDAVVVTPAGETVAQQPGKALPLIIALAAAAGIAVICGVVVFLIRRKK
jgi:hypothetical protein